MSKRFRQYKECRKSHGKRGKLTFEDYKKIIHLRQKMEKQARKNYLKAKSMREYVVLGNALYYWGEDNKSIVASVPNLNEINPFEER